MIRLFFSWIFFLLLDPSFAQTVFRDFPVLDDLARREALFGNDSLGSPIRPLLSVSHFGIDKVGSQNAVEVLPLYTITQFNSHRPYGSGDLLLIPNVGVQQYVSTGIAGKRNFLKFKLQPELVIAQQKQFEGLSTNYTYNQYKDRYYVWGNGDFPERFSKGSYSKIWWGQSHIMAGFGSFESGISSENVWWGPGQFNALSFSNNAPGFPHLTIKTRRPAKTFFGFFETELLIGKLASSRMDPTQNDSLNKLYAKPLPTGKRYLNAMMVSYQPKWIPNIRLGMIRTFQVYDSIPKSNLLDWFPVFEPLQKNKFFKNGNTVEFDGNGRDQQLIIFGDLRIPEGKLELYFEYGRRDHAYNWRDFFLSPEHARGYILGFLKLFDLPGSVKHIQVRGEITHQQESINRIVRYVGGGVSMFGGRNSWHEHSQARGFTNFGQGLGVGTGQGSNVQTIETTLNREFSKIGFVLERVERDQGFYYRAFGELSEHKPWIDYSIGLLYNKKLGNLLFNSRIQLIQARNFQWKLDTESTQDFPRGKNLTSLMAQASLIYFWNKNSE
jgi:hypothetical protein